MKTTSEYVLSWMRSEGRSMQSSEVARAFDLTTPGALVHLRRLEGLGKVRRVGEKRWTRWEVA